MLSQKLNFCPLNEVYRVIRYQQVQDTGYGIEIRFSFPQILFWDGDQLAYVENMRVNDRVMTDTRPEASKLAEHRVLTIYTWEHRKAYDGIRPVIPEEDS